MMFHRRHTVSLLGLITTIVFAIIPSRAIAQTTAPTRATTPPQTIDEYFRAVREGRFDSAIDSLINYSAMIERMAGDEEFKKLTADQRSAAGASVRKMLVLSWKLPGLREAFSTATLRQTGTTEQPADNAVRVDYVIQIEQPRATELVNSALVRRDETGGWRIVDMRTGAQAAPWFSEVLRSAFAGYKREKPSANFADFLAESAEMLERKVTETSPRK